LPFTSSLQAANESVTIGHDVGIRDVSGSQLLTNSIIRVGVFNNATNTNNPLTTTEIASLLNGTQTEVRNNLNALFATNKATYWGNTTVKSLFNTNTLVKLTKTSTPVFATNVIYTLVFNTTSITNATQVGIFTYYNTNGAPLVFPGVNDSTEPTLIFDGYGTNGPFMRPCLGSIGADGNYRLATIGNGYGITSSLTTNAIKNNAFIYFIQANNGATSFTATNLPAGLSINTTTGEISGTPAAVPGTYNIPLAATGPLGARTATLVLTVSDPAAGIPSFTNNLTAQSGQLGLAYGGYTITADNSTTSYSAINLPPGLSCNAGTGVISGTPTQSGTFNVVVQASNSFGTSSKFISITVAKQILSYTNLSFTLYSAGATAAPTTSAGFTPTLYTLGSGLPPGLSLNPNNGIISGTPTGIGTTTVTVDGAANGVVAASGTFTITVNSARPTLNSPTNWTGYVGTEMIYNLTTTTNASAVPPNYYSILGSNDVPASWLDGKLTDKGVFKVTPEESGVFHAEFRANNEVNAAGFGGGDSDILYVTFTIEVAPPTLVNGTDAGKYVTIGETDYVSMAAYNTKTFTINGSGKITMAFFSNLPNWLSGITSGLNASVSGRPTQPGTYTIRKTISNTSRVGVLQSTNRDLVITVVGSSPSVSGSGFIAPPLGRVRQAYREYITASGAARSPADPVSFNASGLPPGLSFATAADRQMGLLTGTPPLGSQGTYAVKFYIANPKGYITHNTTMTILP
jgi:hypothetical protein